MAHLNALGHIQSYFFLIYNVVKLKNTLFFVPLKKNQKSMFEKVDIRTKKIEQTV